MAVHQMMDLFRKHPSDTGSSPMQIAILTVKLSYMTDHMKRHPSDTKTKLHMIKIANRRRKMMDYCKRTDFEGYVKAIRLLGLPDTGKYHK